MERKIALNAADGHVLTALRTDPVGIPRGGVVLLHEIYGLTPFIRAVAGRLAAVGYTVIVPALFDRVAQGVALAATPEDTAQALAYRDALGWDVPQCDITAAAETLAGTGPVFVWGFSFGASLAWRAAGDGFVAAVAYSPGNLADVVTRPPRCRTLVHFGTSDPKTPLPLRRAVAAIPTVTVRSYDTGHAFYAPDRDAFNAAAQAQAWRSSLDFLAREANLVGPTG